MSSSLIRKKQINFEELLPEDLPFLIENGAGLAVDYNGDYRLIPLSTVGVTMSANTGLTPTVDPINTIDLSTAFNVLVNGQTVDIATGITPSVGVITKDESSGYFSIDNGVTNQLIQDIGSQSVFYWNSFIAGYDLDSLTDILSFQYEVGGNSFLVGATGSQGEVGPAGPTGATGPNSLSFELGASKNGIVPNISPIFPSGQFLSLDSSFMNESPFTSFDNLIITKISMSSNSLGAWKGEVYVNDFNPGGVGLSASITASPTGDSYYDNSLNIPINIGDKIALRCQTISTDIDSPRINIFLIGT